MPDNKINTRIQHKHDLEANWLTVTDFKPMLGEIIIYDTEVDADGNILNLAGTNRTTPYKYERVKIGDGINLPKDLPFVSVAVDSELSSTSTNPVQNKIINTALNNKVDKVDGKGLSTNDYTTVEKNKLAGIATGAEVNVQSDWNETDATSDAYIKNKPTGLASTSYVDTAVAGIVNSAPETLNTLNELAAALGDDPNFATTVATALGNKVDKVSLVEGSNITITPDTTNNKITFSVPTASKTQAGVTIVYPADSCTTFSSDSGTVTPLAVQKGAKMFAITRPTSVTDKAITRYSGTDGSVQNSKIIIEDVTNSKDTSKKANVLTIPAEGGKKMVYGYCTDQVDGTSFIGGVFSADATEYPYAQGLAIGGTSGNLLWKGSKVTTIGDLATSSAAGVMSAADKKKLDGIATGANKYTLPGATSSTLGGVKLVYDESTESLTIYTS